MSAKVARGGRRRSPPRRRPRRSAALVGAVAVGVLALLAGLLLRSGRLPVPGLRGPVPRASDVPQVDDAGMEPRVAQAIRAARGKVLADLDSGIAWGNLGIAFDAHELYDSAIACYRIARRLDPREFRWAYFLGRVLELQGGEPEEMLAQYEAAGRLRRDYAPLHIRVGDALQRQDRFDEARAAYERAIAVDPKIWKAHRGLGQALLALQKPEEAVAALERAAALGPEDGASHASLARALLLVGDRARAEAEAARSRELQQIHLSPDPAASEIGAAGVSGGICFRRAQELMDAGMLAEAIANLRISEEVMPNNPHVQVRWGRCLQRMKDLGAAIERYQKALALKDDLDDVQLQVGLLLTVENRPSEAIPFLRKALRTLDDAVTRAALASALAQNGQVREALAEFDRAAQWGPLEASALNNWGSALAQAGKLPAAARKFEEATRANPKSASAYFNWGRVLEDSGDLTGALARYEAAARIDPRGPAAARFHELSATSQK